MASWSEDYINSMVSAADVPVLVGQIMIQEYTIWVYTLPHTKKSVHNELIKEGQKAKQLGGTYWCVKHPPHIPSGQYHIHIFNKDNQIISVNQDGSVHDNLSGQIPGKILSKVQQIFPSIPSDGIIREGLTERKIVNAMFFPYAENEEQNIVKIQLPE